MTLRCCALDVVVLDIDSSTSTACCALADVLRRRGYNVAVSYDTTMKRALRYLDKSQCHVGVVVGEREMRAGVVKVIETWSAGWAQYDLPVQEVSGHLLFR